MKALFYVLLAFLQSSVAFANCGESLDVPVDVEFNYEYSNDRHLPLVAVTVSLPAEVESYTLTTFELTYGEVEEFRIPLHTETSDGMVHTRFTVSQSYISGLELGLHFSSGTCDVYIQRLLKP